MTGSPFAPNDADQVLADFGEDLVCAAVPAVTRGLLDDTTVDDDFNEATVGRPVTVLKVKRGAFGATKVKDTRVTVTSRDAVFSIDQRMPQPASLFDWYALQPVRAKAGG